MEAVAEEERQRAVAELQDGELGEEGDLGGRMQDRIQARIATRMAAAPASAQVSVLVIDAQAAARPPADWWHSLALLALPGAPEGEGPRPLDRLRVTGLRIQGAKKAAEAPGPRAMPPPTARCGPLRLYSGRTSRLQICRPGRGEGGPPGLLGAFLPESPFGVPGVPPLLPPPATLKGHFCDVLGALLAVGTVQLPRSPGPLGGWRASCGLFLLAPSRQLCRVLVEEFAGSREAAGASLEKLRASWAELAAAQRAVAAENATFDWHERRTGVTHFRARRLQLLLSSSPSEPAVRQTVGQIQFSPGEVADAIAHLAAMGLS